MTRYEKIKHYIEVIHRSGDKLTEWEKDIFLPSVARQFNANGDLSDKQLAIVERIYDEKTPTGSKYGEDTDSSASRSRRYEGFTDKDDNAPGISTMKRGWRERY